MCSSYELVKNPTGADPRTIDTNIGILRGRYNLQRELWDFRRLCGGRSVDDPVSNRHNNQNRDCDSDRFVPGLKSVPRLETQTPFRQTQAWTVADPAPVCLEGPGGYAERRPAWGIQLLAPGE
jgi:hypothetical protein